MAAKAEYYWYACSGNPMPVDAEKARRLSKIGERVTPNPNHVETTSVRKKKISCKTKN